MFQDLELDVDAIKLVEDESEEDLHDDWAGIRDDTEDLHFESASFLQQIEGMDISLDSVAENIDSSAFLGNVMTDRDTNLH